MKSLMNFCIIEITIGINGALLVIAMVPKSSKIQMQTSWKFFQISELWK